MLSYFEKRCLLQEELAEKKQTSGSGDVDETYVSGDTGGVFTCMECWSQRYALSEGSIVMDLVALLLATSEVNPVSLEEWAEAAEICESCGNGGGLYVAKCVRIVKDMIADVMHKH